MSFSAFRNLIRPIARSFLSHNNNPIRSLTTNIPHSHTSPTFELRSMFGAFQPTHPPWMFRLNQLHSLTNHLQSLTDTRLSKRRPSLAPKRKRVSLKPPGPYAWVQYTPGEPIPANRPNEGSVKRRNEKKRMRLKRAFILSEKKKRKAEMQEAKKKKMTQRVERKMAAVARDREWAQRLAEMQKLEAEKATQA